jgi:alkylglycerol monooxygenase
MGEGGALNPVALGIPVFFGAVMLEAWLARRRGRADAYAVGTALSDVACGATYQVFELVLKLGVLAIYGVLWQEYRLVTWPADSVWPWVVALVGVDFLYYWWHRTSHVVNVMWAVHAVHHQSEDYNFAVALRQPLLEPLTWMPFFAVLALLGVPPEVILLAFAIDLFYQFWLHTELVQRLPRPIEWFFNTPSHHRVHHGIEAQYLDRNYGGVLVVWDRLFGTFEPEGARPTYGTTIALRSYNPLWGNLAHFHRMAKLARAAARVRDKLYTIVAHPAWLPPGVDDPQKSGDDAPRTKYRPRPRRAVMIHVAALFAIASLSVGPLVAWDARLSVPQLMAGATAIALVHVSIAAWIERRPWASAAAIVALAAFTGAALWILGTHLSWPVGAAASGLAAALALGTWPRKGLRESPVAPSAAPDTLRP